jgi:hypothetical protein
MLRHDSFEFVFFVFGNHKTIVVAWYSMGIELETNDGIYEFNNPGGQFNSHWHFDVVRGTVKTTIRIPS